MNGRRRIPRTLAWAGLPLLLAAAWAGWRLQAAAPAPGPGAAAAALIASSVCTVPVALPQRARWGDTVRADPFRPADRAAPRGRRT